MSIELGCLSLGVGTTLAETIYLRPSADTTLIEAFPANNFGANEFFNAGTTQNYTKNRALLKFDIAGQIPAGAKIRSVTLTLEVVGQPVDGNTPSTFELRRMLRDWGEGNKSGHPPQQSGLGQPAATNEACWTHRFASTTNTWAAPGASAGVDFTTNSSSETYVYGTDFSPYLFDTTPQMAADVQSWLGQPSNNFGWMLITQAEDYNFSARRFGSREDPLLSPRLAVEYFIPRIDALTMTGSGAVLHVSAESGQGYAVEFCDALNYGGWFTLTNIAPVEAATSLVIQDHSAAPHRYYRLSLP